MKLFFKTSLVVVALAVATVIGSKMVYAADYTITISDDVADVKNQDIIFQYSNIGPGFKADALIHIINQSTQPAIVELVDIKPVDSPVAPVSTRANNLLPLVNLSLLRDGVVIAQGENGAYTKLIGSRVCIPAQQSVDLTARFELPAGVGNEAQNTSLWAQYYFSHSTGDCQIAAPLAGQSVPNVPNTGETMLPFIALGGASAVSLVSVILLSMTFLFPLLFKRRKSDKRA
ncbi:hypothetical protein FWF48_01185 [Candidatus Saccharibacteria bacterium]|nr:hypothetical protein [Candidatus Saccharibacteria bacterium]